MAQKKQNYSISSGRIQPGYMHQSDMYPTSPAKEIWEFWAISFPHLGGGH